MNFLGKQGELPALGWCTSAAWVWGILKEGGGGCLRVHRRKQMSSGGIQSRSGWKRELATGLLPLRAILPQEASEVYL